MALSAKMVRETITEIKLDGSGTEFSRVALTCIVGAHAYHVWLGWPSLEFMGGFTGTQQTDTVYKNPVDRGGRPRTIYLNAGTGEGKLVWEAMSKEIPRLAEALKADLVIRVEAERVAHEAAVKEHRIAEAAPDLFKALLAIIKTSALASRIECDLYDQAKAALNKAGESI